MFYVNVTCVRPFLRFFAKYEIFEPDNFLCHVNKKYNSNIADTNLLPRTVIVVFHVYYCHVEPYHDCPKTNKKQQK